MILLDILAISVLWIAFTQNYCSNIVEMSRYLVPGIQLLFNWHLTTIICHELLQSIGILDTLSISLSFNSDNNFCYYMLPTTNKHRSISDSEKFRKIAGRLHVFSESITLRNSDVVKIPATANGKRASRLCGRSWLRIHFERSFICSRRTFAFCDKSTWLEWK